MNIRTAMVVLILVIPFEVIAKEAVSLPLNLGFGPALNYIPPVISEDQTFHYSLKLDIYACLDREFLNKHSSRIPAKYRGFVKGRDEIHISHILIPESLIISPAFSHTGIYGVNFRPISLGIPLIKLKRLRSVLGIGLNVTYMFIHSDRIFDSDGYMNFLRAGLNFQLNNRVMISRRFLISMGLDTYFYPPQEIRRNSPILETGDLNRSLWFVAQLYLLVNFRLPYTTMI